MVSVEDIQKKNELTKELKEHGFAIDFGEAFKQADRIYNKKKTSPEVSFSDGQVAVVEDNVVNETVDELKERIRILERKNQYSKSKEQEYENRMKELVGKMNELIKNLNMVEMNQQAFQRKLSSMKKDVSNSQPGGKEVQQKIPSHEQAELPDDSKKITTPIDRNGVAPSEVSVEKIFYSGSNPQ